MSDLTKEDFDRIVEERRWWELSPCGIRDEENIAILWAAAKIESLEKGLEAYKTEEANIRATMRSDQRFIGQLQAELAEVKEAIQKHRQENEALPSAKEQADADMRLWAILDTENTEY